MSTLAKRQEYTSDQWQELESEFEKIKYPDAYMREELAKEMGLTAEQVNKWFQSRRIRERKWDKLAEHTAQIKKKMELICISSKRYAKLESEFEKIKYPDISMRKKMAAEYCLTETEVKIWFRNRREQWKLQGAEETLGDQREKQKRQQKENKTEQTVAETKLQNLSSDQLDILKGAFEERKYPDIFMLEELARETGITVYQIQVWFQKRREQHRREEREENAKIKLEKNVCENEKSQVQSTPNAIGFASVGCTSISAVRGRAKCRRLICHVVTFPVNAVAKLTKKVRSVKCAFSNKGKNKKE